ncbi:tetratricopeptide repeat protein [Eudoraea sp.]|uniref:tetratricopeptide repeat protein n=1 Tax=Eudoraea sp. TaxID=1979955 RepID=UPI003C782FDF
MNFRLKWVIYILGIFIFSQLSYAQEEESAEVFLEDYTDEFQEAFFEALKQKGIENYDKAVNLFLKCKKLDSTNNVVDFELAKSYLANKQYILAEQSGIDALKSEPENFWYLNTVVDIMQKQGRPIAMIEEQISFDNNKLKENLALIYYQKKNYQESSNILKELKDSSFKEALALKIKDSLDRPQNVDEIKPVPPVQNTNLNPLLKYKEEIGELILNKNYSSLIIKADEALEEFPSQPYFYFAKGMGLNRSGKQKEATEVLETALDFLIDDIELGNNIYRELANVYTFLGNSSKANMYLSKIKSGS